MSIAMDKQICIGTSRTAQPFKLIDQFYNDEQITLALFLDTVVSDGEHILVAG